jgi:hypothetical protein
MAEAVEVILRLLNARQYESDADKAAKATAGIGHAAEKSGKQAGVSWKSVAKWGGAAGAIYGATKFVKSSTAAYEEHAKATLAVNRATGMNIKQSSEWAAVLKTRGLQTTAFQRGIATLSKQMGTASTNAGKQTTKVSALSGQYQLAAKRSAVLSQEYKTSQAHVDALSKRYDQLRIASGGKTTQAIRVMRLELAAAKKPLAELHKEAGTAARQTNALQRGLFAAAGKGRDATVIFRKLGVNMADVRKGNTERVIEQVAEGLSKLRNPMERAALTTKLFGRAGLALAPMLYKGKKGIQDQLAVAGKYVDFNAKNAEEVKKQIAAQRELKLAYMGVQVSLGKALAPVILQVTQLIVKITRLLAPLIKQGWLVKGVIGAIALAFVAWKVMTLVQIALNWQLAASTWAAIGIIGLAVVAIAALALGVYLAWKHFKWFRDAVYAVWNAIKFTFNWVRRNWQLLLVILTGPIGLATVAIVRNFDKIKHVFQLALDWVKNHWPLIVGLLVGPVGLAVAESIKHWDTLKQAVVGVFDTIKQAVQTVLDMITSIPDKISSAVKSIPGGGLAAKGVGAVTNVAHKLGIPGGQHGGTIGQPGMALVGERGPELLYLPPAAQIVPLPAGGDTGVTQIRVPVFLDRRQIAEAVGSFAADKAARR